MINLIKECSSNRYQLFSSSVVGENLDHIKRILLQKQKHLRERFESKDTTWIYPYYNIFGVCSMDSTMYRLFTDLTEVIKKYLVFVKYPYDITKTDIWMKAWLNVHNPATVLEWHNHHCSFHGYISIDPKHTHTEFEDKFVIDNRPGQIYIGPSGYFHRVKVDEFFEDERITIGFDVVINTHNFQVIDHQPAFIPIRLHGT